MRFVLIDRLVEIEAGRRASASVRFRRSLELFRDHFPGRPIVPGVLLTEAMGQTAGWLIAATIAFERWPLLIMIEHAKFRRLVEPEEDVQLSASIASSRGGTFAADAAAHVGVEKVASARLVFQVMELSAAESDRAVFGEWARRTFDALGGTALLAAPPAPGDRR